ncbi:MAG: hypothetical protein IPN95_32215 [Bacteroidetes bacterium]|nr:hypothetical protein [Bacteroidota bacterium]
MNSFKFWSGRTLLMCEGMGIREPCVKVSSRMDAFVMQTYVTLMEIWQLQVQWQIFHGEWR